MLDLDTRTIDFILAFLQAKMEIPVYMYIPAGMQLQRISSDDKSYILKLKKSLYGLKQASANWYYMLWKALHSRGFKDSVADSCVFLRQDLIVLVYVDECILIGKNKSVIEEFIKSLKNGPENFIFMDEGDLNKYLGVEIKKIGSSGSF